MSEKKAFKAYIKIVKSMQERNMDFMTATIVTERLIYAKDKNEVKKILAEKYPQCFPEAKVYERESKNKAQFFFVTIYELSSFDLKAIERGPWACIGCGKTHENRYVNPPKTYGMMGDNYEFCQPLKEEDYRLHADDCLKLYRDEVNKNYDFPDDHSYIRPDSESYIYKITEKDTGKSYIGKTKNMPFFRWFNHLKHSTSPFGVYLRNSSLADWTFEVLRILPPLTVDSEVLRIESEYILKYDSINNGFNKVISNKTACIDDILNSDNKKEDFEE